MSDLIYTVVVILFYTFTGYITNVLAIKMLFRPRNPIYLGSFKLPLTPGLIPKEKEKLALKIGQTVTQLIQPESIQIEVSSLKSLTKIYEVFNNVLDGLPFGRLVPQGIRLHLFELIFIGVITNIDEITNVIDLQGIVYKTVSEYDNNELESLILSVANKELRMITWFGAFLGFLLGILQLFITEIF